MLFFRDEEHARLWCTGHSVPVRPIVTIAQLWQLAVAWYSTRLEPTARRPGPDEMRQIFGRIGLVDEFWDPRSDRFQA
ncbi:MAG TPA: hypothetical protein VK886_09720 [Vicinamibacterales bacterium]|nr:hypothetical protein [Vicinamibacterales bacterium]